ncbi:MAG TPA: hypothetical protein VMA13_07450 [Candidatus Saccharimonadales bacterium]|nr:hypothetical protein [Candidatus Saccharimonadales bacterium]
MATLKEGSFSLNLGLVQLGGNLSDEDRQCAWELYTEIATRVAVVGKRSDKDCTDFSGELYAESLDSLYAFFCECRGIMRRFPVGRVKDPDQEHLGVLINRILTQVLRPFLEKWSGHFRAWWTDPDSSTTMPYELQAHFPDLEAFLKDWSDIRKIMRGVEAQLREQYKLVPLE